MLYKDISRDALYVIGVKKGRYVYKLETIGFCFYTERCKAMYLPYVISSEDLAYSYYMEIK